MSNCTNCGVRYQELDDGTQICPSCGYERGPGILRRYTKKSKPKRHVPDPYRATQKIKELLKE
jgi:uncharacterized Zn finger protein (UPF0148 family)